MPPKHYWRSLQPIRMIHLCGPSPKDPQNYKNLKYLKKTCSIRGGRAWGGVWGWQWGVERPPNFKKNFLKFFLNFLLLSSKFLLRFFSRSFCQNLKFWRKNIRNILFSGLGGCFSPLPCPHSSPKLKKLTKHLKKKLFWQIRSVKAGFSDILPLGWQGRGRSTPLN